MPSAGPPPTFPARLYAIVDTGYVPPHRWSAVARQLIEGGADLIQVRAKRETPARRAELAAEILPLLATPHRGITPAQLIINDDVELCARTPHAGLHIGQDDMDPAVARSRIGPDRILGLSTHSWAQVQAALALPAGVLSYFCVGPVFATPTKPDYVPVGLELVQRVAAAAPPLPWFAIGGINRATLGDVLAAGARRVVVVSDLLKAENPAATARRIREQVCAAGAA